METQCNKCGGVGVEEINGKLYECQCAFIRRVAASMPHYIRRSKVLNKHLDLPLISMINKSIFVSASWNDMKAIIKLMMIKYSNKFIKISSDAEIRDVYVGSKSKSSKSDDFNGEIYNNLQDLMDPPDLMIIKLNEISNKNKAASGALLEALNYRLDRDKPTWAFSDTDKKFDNSSFAYSQAVASLLSNEYQHVNIPVMIQKPTIDNSLFSNSLVSTFDVNYASTDKIDKEKKHDANTNDDNVVDEDESLSMYGKGLKITNKFRRNHE